MMIRLPLVSYSRDRNTLMLRQWEETVKGKEREALSELDLRRLFGGIGRKHCSRKRLFETGIAERQHFASYESNAGRNHTTARISWGGNQIQNAYYHNRVIWHMDELFRPDPGARKRLKPHQRTGIETSKFAGLVTTALVETQKAGRS
eukprot:5211342-Amphidinium_carterae.1